MKCFYMKISYRYTICSCPRQPHLHSVLSSYTLDGANTSLNLSLTLADSIGLCLVTEHIILNLCLSL